MVTAFMGLTSSRDVTVSRTLSTWTESRPTYFPDQEPDRLSARSAASPLSHLDGCDAAHREEYGGNSRRSNSSCDDLSPSPKVLLFVNWLGCEGVQPRYAGGRLENPVLEPDVEESRAITGNKGALVGEVSVLGWVRDLRSVLGFRTPACTPVDTT